MPGVRMPRLSFAMALSLLVLATCSQLPMTPEPTPSLVPATGPEVTPRSKADLARGTPAAATHAPGATPRPLGPAPTAATRVPKLDVTATAVALPTVSPTPYAVSKLGINQRGCQGSGTVQFGASPFGVEEIQLIQPMGLMVGGHVTPIDHGYIFGIGTPDVPPDQFEIYSPAKGWIIDLSRTQRGGSPPFIDHAVTIEFTCTFAVHYSNMSSFDPKILAQSGEIPVNGRSNMRIPVEEGEVIGRTGPYGIDFSVWNTELTLTGFIVPEHYFEPWKLHSADLFEYFKEPLKSQLLAKNLRQAEPRGGKIDYDIDGRLVGNWFQEGTNGYGGLNRGGEGYWEGHLAITYDALDPTGIVVSIGNWPGGARQFGVKGNAPDPQDIDVSFGVVRYELVQPDFIVASTGQYWDRRSYSPDLKFKPDEQRVEGVVLLQMVADRRLKVEAFPGKRASEVTGFTDAARYYER